MKIYIAALYSRREEMRLHAEALAMAGLEVTSRWLWTEDDGGREAAKMCIEDIDQSDVLVIFTNPVGSMNSGGGRWFETGYAYGCNKLVAIIGEREMIFCYLPAIVRCKDLGEFMKILEDYERDIALAEHPARPFGR